MVFMGDGNLNSNLIKSTIDIIDSCVNKQYNILTIVYEALVLEKKLEKAFEWVLHSFSSKSKEVELLSI